MYGNKIKPRRPWGEVVIDAYHRRVLDCLAKRVTAVHTRRSAEWLRLVGYVYEGSTVPPAVADSIVRLQMYCEGKLKPPKRFYEPPQDCDPEIEDW